MDIQRIADMIQELVPEGKVVIGHGQLTEIELEKRMKKFYEGESNILLSTTIIESGIDIPTANTMIINKADRFGLAQLHQLRGRIGRSDKKAYAYLIIPQNRKVSPIAEKRLKAMQTFADIGSGFAIASSDLEIRGAGDILGAEQSGHISQIGLELYMELLQEAVQEIQGGEYISFRDIDIQTGHKAYIPEDYIFDPGTRLKTYKRISNTQTKQQLEEISEEITDIFGECPEEVKELFFVIELRNLLQKIRSGFIKGSFKVAFN
jgi:transcription-repair coupling factor (superfamily II helicase)